MRRFLIEVFITDTSETFHMWHQQSMLLHLRQKCQVFFQDFFSIPLPPQSLPPHPPPPPSSPKYDFFLEVQQQPLVELSSCFSLSSCSRNSIPPVNKKKSLSVCISQLHVVPTGQRSEYNPGCTKAVLCDGNFGQFQ